MGMMGVAKHNIIFGGVDSANYGFLIDGAAVYDAPERDVEQVEIPGRNGTVTIDNGRFDNHELTYKAYVYVKGLDQFTELVNNFRNALMSQKGYQRLWDSFNPGQYRMAQFIKGFEISPVAYNTAAEITLKFDCKPQRFLVSGEETIDMTATGAIENPTRFEALPGLQVIGRGQLEVEGNVITVTPEQTGSVYIDSEQMEAYQVIDGEAISVNSSVSFSTGKFPTLAPGLNHITLGTGITMVKIVPHWWVI